MIRLSLICKFAEEPIKFSSTTATYILQMAREDALQKLSDLCLSNAYALQAALEYCRRHGIGAFRVSSEILPIKTHPAAGYELERLPNADKIIDVFQQCDTYAKTYDIRLSLHPGQFTVLNSPKSSVVESSLAEVEYHAEVAALIGADVINIHGGGGYGDKQAALARLARNIDRLSSRARTRLSLENDDTVYTPADLIPFCLEHGLPFAYDVHHHRVLPDGQGVEEVTAQTMQTWNREPLLHISSPKEGWDSTKLFSHHDFILKEDIPGAWLTLSSQLDFTLDVEAKAKEIAVLQFMTDLEALGATIKRPR